MKEFQQAGEPEGGGFPDPFAVIRALRDRWKVIAAVAAAVVLATAVYAFTATPVYTAAAKIILDASSRQPFEDANSATRLSNDPFAVDSQIAVISSASVLRPVVEAQNLVDDPEFGDGGGTGLLKTLLGGLFGSKEADPADGEARIINAVRALGKAVNVSRQGATYVINIAVRSESPSKAVRLANAIAQGYLSEQQRSSRQRADRLSEQVDERLISLRERLRETEQRVQRFKAENQLQSTAEGTLLVGQELDGLNAQLVEARSALATADASYREIQRYLQRQVDPTALGDVVSNPRITQLLEQYANAVRAEASLSTDLLPSHPTLQRARAQVRRITDLIRDELRAVGEAKKVERDVAEERVANLTRQIDRLRSNSDAGEEQLITLRELETEAAATRAVYENVLSRAKELGDLEQVTAPLARIISPAELPEGPSWPKKKILLALAGVLGLMLGTGLVASLEVWRQLRAEFGPKLQAAAPAAPAPRPQAQTSREVAGLPVIGALPAIDGLKPRHLDQLDLKSSARLAYRILATDDIRGLPAPAANFETAVAALNTRLLAGRREGESMAILGVEPHLGEGLSLTAFSLALGAAAEGLKVLLVDANARDKGLTRLLDDNASLRTLTYSERIVSNRLFDLSFLSLVSGAPKHRPPELTEEQLEELRDIAGGYDLMFVDAGTLDDARSLEPVSALCDRVLVTLGGPQDVYSRLSTLDPVLREIAGANPVSVVQTRIS
ncbi:hypothetical protein HPQ64_01460 [Rhizobiales bacterium]|uniref:GumC family protein n=1 Tax=Hongsoonwoonella zoysiae TaxID=2821844 RepID=UPI0015609586|nr:exopolysaccharide transport family protein [Hongsoonwoonella zoysiae]NRG16352.1 hypothetical protein [Hongsoonwoonella zoysiae]